jgi:hypothetical protein
LPQTGETHGGEPKENREKEYIDFLSPSVKITVSGGSGSGTIIYYDKNNNIAYVATCGHLWPKGKLTADQAKQKKLKCYITTWYKNKEKLKEPQKYEADVLFYSFVDGCDTGLIKFSPDYEPSYFGFAPKNYEYKKGKTVNSMGCDGAREVAHYDVEIVGLFDPHLVTQKNSPRPGRSGGGLVDDKNFYIGTCWGTSSIDGSGKGYFTPVKVIYNFWKENGYEFLLINKEAQKIKVFDRNKNKFLDNEILLPQSE